MPTERPIIVVADSKRKTAFKTGMFLLENITSGMYNDPLAILREYIQNSVDSIDLAHQEKDAPPSRISIKLDPFAKRLVIHDNGQGVPLKIAEDVLCSIGSSNKVDSKLRGFRGIGRLGGIAFSDRAIFKTKAEGEVVESVQEWDCVSLRKIIGERKKKNLTLTQILRNITSFSQNNCKDANGSYFEVTLEGVNSFRNYLFDITRVERYLNQVAPVPFDSNEFSFADIIEEHLKNNLSNYSIYNIFINDKQIVKPYKDYVNVTKGSIDKLTGVNLFELAGSDSRKIGVGWFCEREELLGSISRGDLSSGMRVRHGNIMIGDNHFLDGSFREARFNSYITGEIHIESPFLIPNSRRDDFIDNDEKNVFFNEVERELGLPISKEIRLRSRQTSIKTPRKINNKLAKTDQNGLPEDKKIITQEITEICGDCPKKESLLNKIANK